MYVGAHYPRDVLAGAILGSAWGLLGGIVYGYVLIRIGKTEPAFLPRCRCAFQGGGGQLGLEDR